VDQSTLSRELLHSRLRTASKGLRPQVSSWSELLNRPSLATMSGISWCSWDQTVEQQHVRLAEHARPC
jgi:hypothetical protein